jgi:peptide/nickel transport system substrate-binding protein
MMFWYEDWLLNEEVTPVIDPSWIAGGEVVKVTVIDDYTIRFEYTEPQPLFLGWPLSKGTQHHRMLKAKHYLSQFHKDYVSEDKLQEMMDDAEVAQGKMIAGEVDYNGFITTTKNYPLYKQNEERGGYRTILWDSGKGSEVFFFFNLSHDDPDMREVFQDARFRRAMSVAINREEINEFLYFGRAEVRNYTLLSTSKYFEERFATAYTQYDPEQASAWLDEMGLVDSDGDGWRDLANGEPFSFVIEFTSAEDPLKTDTVELVTQSWQDVGINVTSKELAGELWGQRLNGNKISCSIWHGGWETGILFPASNPLLAGNGRYAWPKFWDHFFGGQEIDQEIPAIVQELYDTWAAATTASNEADLVRLGKKMLEMQAENVWLIGTVGLAPHPIIAKKNLRNVPETGHYTWEVQWMISRNPEQFFFE